MSGNIKFSLLTLVFFLSGCAGFGQSVSVGQLTSSQVQRLEKISIIQTGSINTKDFKVLKRVKGISCSGDGTIHISKSDAINQLKLKAALSNADALTNLVCEDNQVLDWKNNCWKSWICFADVITLKNSQSAVSQNPNTQRYSASTITPRQKFNLALNYSKQGQHEKAIPLYKEIIQINPQNIDESITGDLFPIKIDAYVNLGSSYNDLNRPHEAIRYHKEAMRLNPNNWMPHFNLGLSYHLLSRFQEAITSYKKSIQIKPEDSRIHNRLGMSYDKLGEYQEAIASYKEAIRLNPKDYMALHNLGNSYFAIGHSQKAISKWKEALRINPSFTNSRLNLNQIEGKINRPRTQPPVAKAPPQSPKPSPQSGTGSGFFVSKMGHVITNAHVVQNCKKVTIGDNANKQVPAELINTDRSNDLALLKLSTLEMASAESKSLIQKLGIVVVPLASKGLLRSDDVRLGEKVLVAGYPFGDFFSNSIKVTTGVVSSTRGAGDDSGQFQLDAAIQPGNSGGPIYDSGGNIVGVVISQLDKLKVAKAIGSMPENVNFGIKASTVRQFLTSSGLPSKKSERTEEKSTEQLAEIAQNQALMVMCLQ